MMPQLFRHSHENSQIHELQSHICESTAQTSQVQRQIQTNTATALWQHKPLRVQHMRCEPARKEEVFVYVPQASPATRQLKLQWWQIYGKKEDGGQISVR